MALKRILCFVAAVLTDNGSVDARSGANTHPPMPSALASLEQARILSERGPRYFHADVRTSNRHCATNTEVREGKVSVYFTDCKRPPLPSSTIMATTTTTDSTPSTSAIPQRY